MYWGRTEKNQACCFQQISRTHKNDAVFVWWERERERVDAIRRQIKKMYVLKAGNMFDRGVIIIVSPRPPRNINIRSRYQRFFLPDDITDPVLVCIWYEWLVYQYLSTNVCPTMCFCTVFILAVSYISLFIVNTDAISSTC